MIGPTSGKFVCCPTSVNRISLSPCIHPKSIHEKGGMLGEGLAAIHRNVSTEKRAFSILHCK